MIGNQPIKSETITKLKELILSKYPIDEINKFQTFLNSNEFSK